MAQPVKPTESPYGWFSPSDFQFLVKHLLRFEDRDAVVLVGGQAVAAWAIFYDIAVPTTDAPYLTQDADFHATEAAARHLAHELGGELRLAKIDDLPLNVGTIVFESPTSGDKLLIDILSCVYGLADDEVQELSIPIEVAGGEIRVLHPLLCLESRIFNLADIPEKKTPEGLAQAQVAMQVVGRYLSDLASADQRQTLRAIWRITKLAATRQSVETFLDYGIDLLQLVDVSMIHHEDFRRKSWPAKLSDIERKRSIAARRRERS